MRVVFTFGDHSEQTVNDSNVLGNLEDRSASHSTTSQLRETKRYIRAHLSLSVWRHGERPSGWLKENSRTGWRDTRVSCRHRNPELPGPGTEVQLSHSLSVTLASYCKLQEKTTIKTKQIMTLLAACLLGYWHYCILQMSACHNSEFLQCGDIAVQLLSTFIQGSQHWQWPWEGRRSRRFTVLPCIMTPHRAGKSSFSDPDKINGQMAPHCLPC